MNNQSINEISSNSKVYFPNLDGLRSIAFLMVYFQHGMWSSFQLLDIQGTFIEKIINLFCNGGIGVSIFFVLSGFLITYLILLELEINGKLNVGYFYIRRSLRIWPLYFAVIIFSLFLYPYLKGLMNVATNLAHTPEYYFLFLSNFDVINIEKNYPGLQALSASITWSVAIEEQFYLIWPVLFYFIPKRFFSLIFISIILASVAFRYLYVDDRIVLYFHSLGVCADLAFGGLCAYGVLYYKSFRELFEKLNKFVIILVYGFALVWLMYGEDILGFYYAPVFTRLINVMFFAFVILEQNYSSNSFYKFSQSKFLTYWGKYTFGLYLLHPIAINILDVLCRILNMPYKNSFVLFLSIGILGLAFSHLLSYVAYELFEVKFLKLKGKFSFEHRADLPAPDINFLSGRMNKVE